MLVGWFELTIALAKLDRVDEAEAAARQAVMIDPASPAAQGNLASALLQQGNTRAALEAIRIALVLDPSNALNQLILQRVQESMSDDDSHSEDRPRLKAMARTLGCRGTNDSFGHDRAVLRLTPASWRR